MKLTTAIETFLACGDYSEETVEMYTPILATHADAVGADREIGDVRPEDILSWYAGVKDPALSKATVSIRARTVRAFWNWLAETLDVKSPFTIKLPACDPDPLHTKAVEPADRDAMMMDVWRRGYLRDFAIMRFLADTGTRASGICALTREKLDLEERDALVTGKGGHPYYVDFSAATGWALQRWLKVRPETWHDCVFTSESDTRPLDRRSLYAIFWRAAKRLGIEENYGPHAWRHEVGQRMADAGYPLPLIQAKLGHTSSTTTALYYLNQDRERLRKATDNLTPRLKGIPDGSYVELPDLEAAED
jgi:site-specific recombinase XerD